MTMPNPTPPLTTLRRVQADLGALLAPITAALAQEGAQLRCLVVELAQVHADLTARETPRRDGIQAEEIVQAFHAMREDLHARLAVFGQTLEVLTPTAGRQALATMLVDHAQQCLVLALGSPEWRHATRPSQALTPHGS